MADLFEVYPALRDDSKNYAQQTQVNRLRDLIDLETPHRRSEELSIKHENLIFIGVFASLALALDYYFK